MREEGGALGGLEGQVGVGALEKVKKGKGHRGETSRSKGMVLGSLAVCVPHYMGVKGPGPGTPPQFPTCHMAVITGLLGRLKEIVCDVLSTVLQVVIMGSINTHALSLEASL